MHTKYFVYAWLSTSLILAILGQWVMLVGVVFSIVFLLRGRVAIRATLHPRRVVFLVTLGFGLFFESTAILTGYSTNEFGQSTLFHPDPSLDLIISLFYWIPFSLFWTYLLTRYAYTLRSIILLGGTYGALTEQLFVVPLMLINGNPLGLLVGFYLFGLYGSMMGLIYMIIEHLLPKQQKRTVVQYALPLIVLFPILFLIFALIVEPLKQILGV